MNVCDILRVVIAALTFAYQLYKDYKRYKHKED
jgi:hypothetical protein